jgi:hypothetical protein
MIIVCRKGRNSKGFEDYVVCLQIGEMQTQIENSQNMKSVDDVAGYWLMQIAG